MASRSVIHCQEQTQSLGDHESAFWFRDWCAVFLRGFEPESDSFLGIANRFGAGVPMSHATGSSGTSTTKALSSLLHQTIIS
jgi:hypothetical protein